MERDFMGLNSKETLALVKEEMDDGAKDSAFTRGSGIQWPFLNKVSALPHFMATKVAQEDWAKKTGSDPHASSGFVTISAADAFDPRHKGSVGEFQKIFNHDRQGGTHFSMAAHPVQHDAHFVHRSPDMKMFPGSNQPGAVPLFKTHFGSTDHKLAAGSMKEQSFAGIPVTAGITEQWDKSKASGAPAQLTIFYKGTVNIFDDISPEKAQAIMFLAGNGSSSLGQSRAQAKAPTPKMAACDGVLMSQPMNTPPCSAISSPISVSSHPVPHSGSRSPSRDELVAAKPTGLSATPVQKLEPQNAVNTMGSVAAKTMMPSAVPQARKASLARFLEKRKERVMNMAPYNLGKKAQECGTPVSHGMGLSGTLGDDN